VGEVEIHGHVGRDVEVVLIDAETIEVGDRAWVGARRLVVTVDIERMCGVGSLRAVMTLRRGQGGGQEKGWPRGGRNGYRRQRPVPPRLTLTQAGGHPLAGLLGVEAGETIYVPLTPAVLAEIRAGRRRL